MLAPSCTNVIFFVTRAAAQPSAWRTACCAQNTWKRGLWEPAESILAAGRRCEQTIQDVSCPRWDMLSVDNAMGRFSRLSEEIVCPEGLTVLKDQEAFLTIWGASGMALRRHPSSHFQLLQPAHL